SGCPQLQPDCCDSELVQVFHLHSNQQRLTAQTELVPDPAEHRPSHNEAVHDALRAHFQLQIVVQTVLLAGCPRTW
ncbi:hypothetical protein, partial [Streptomyces sp. NPDC058086]|uniref:hypothetical protein n=1 Tax=Streptomyces sp. NPDC058086 TaxID=3346334 RepID=UPI0036E35C2D